MKKFIFVVDDDVSHEELEEVIKERIPSLSNQSTKKGNNNLKRKITDSSPELSKRNEIKKTKNETSADLSNDENKCLKNEKAQDLDFQNGNCSGVIIPCDELSINSILRDPDDAGPSKDLQDDRYYNDLSESIPDGAYVALDCEMVGVGDKGRTSVLARCSIVDYNGTVLYDKYVRPSETITDYRTRWSGIRPSHMTTAIPINKAIQEIKECIKNKIVIGHAVYNDFKVIQHVPVRDEVRDTASCKLLSEWAGSHGNSLKKLAAAILNQTIQIGRNGHCSVEDARASLNLFKRARSQWEPQLLKSWGKKGFAVEAKLQDIIRHTANEVNYLEDEFWPDHLSG